MTRADWLSLLIVPVLWLLYRGSTPKPWTAPGYGKRRQTDFMVQWRKKRDVESAQKEDVT